MNTKTTIFDIKKIIAIVIIIVIIIVASRVLLLKNDEIKNAPTAVKPTISLKLVSANSSTLIDKKRYLATLSAEKSIKISSKLSGYIQNIYAKEGDFVKKGMLLIKIDSKEIRANISSLKSSINAMQKDLDYKTLVYERNKKLYDKKALSKEKLDLSAVALSATKANIDANSQKINSLLNQLEYLNIKAPFDGIVANLFINIGDLAMPNKPIIKLNTKKQKLTFAFLDKEIKKGLDVFIGDIKYGKIKTIYDDAKNGLKIAEVELLRDTDFANGENLNVSVVFGKTNGCMVDSRTILYSNNKTRLLVYKSNNSFEFMDINITLLKKDKAIITPCPSDKIALSSQSKLAILPQYKDVNIIEAK